MAINGTTLGTALHAARTAGTRSSSPQALIDAQAEGVAIASAANGESLAGVMTVNTEAADVITVDILATDGSGTRVAAITRFLAELRSLVDGTVVLVGAFTMAETGDGAEVSGTAKPILLLTTDAAGVAQISITDIATGSGLTLELVLTPLASDATKPTAVTSAVITFD